MSIVVSSRRRSYVLIVFFERLRDRQSGVLCDPPLLDRAAAPVPYPLSGLVKAVRLQRLVGEWLVGMSFFVVTVVPRPLREDG
jgi:hypothetical protein